MHLQSATLPNQMLFENEIALHIIDQLTIVLNRYVKPGTTSKKTAKPTPSVEIKTALEEMNYPLFIIPDSVLIYRAQQAGIPVSHYAANSQVDKAYRAIANHLSLILTNS